MKDEPVPREQDKHRHAYEIYQAAGPARTYGMVATQLGVAERTVRYWAKIFDWRGRVRVRDHETAKQEVNAVRRSVRHDIEENLKIALGAKRKAIKAITQGRVKPQFGDLARIMALEEKLRAKRPPPTPVDNQTPEQKREWARSTLREILSKTEPDTIVKEYHELKELLRTDPGRAQGRIPR